jgi:regulator of PEP synthase PpsR (kinase-PPPase family)
MPINVMIFNEDEQYSHACALNGHQYYSAVAQIDRELRSFYKHLDENNIKDCNKVIRAIESIVHDVLAQYPVEA